MSRPSPARRAPSAFTRFGRLLALRDGLGGNPAAADRRVRLAAEPLEDRVVPDGRPLPFPQIFVGAGPGHPPVVRAYDALTGTLKFEAAAYGPTFAGGVRVGTADLNRDGVPDAVVAPGPGRSPLVRVLDGKAGAEIAGPAGSFLAFAKSFEGGVHVAAADVDGDGTPDVVTAAALPNGARVRAFSGKTGGVVADFAVPGPGFAAGLTVAAADLTADGKAEVVVGALGSGKVRTYDPLTGTIVAGPLGSFDPFGAGYDGGVFVGSDALAGDVDDDGTPDLAVGTGPARGPGG